MWIGVALLLAVFVGVVGWFFTKPRTQSQRMLSHRTTVAVLPFQNATSDANLEYLGTALPDEVITTLSYAPTLSHRCTPGSQMHNKTIAALDRLGGPLGQSARSEEAIDRNRRLVQLHSSWLSPVLALGLHYSNEEDFASAHVAISKLIIAWPRSWQQ